MSDRPGEDQATRLRTQVENSHQSANKQSSFPPRREFHHNNKKKTKWKISFPVIRLLLIIFIVLILLFLTVRFWGEEYLSSVEKESKQSSFDQVSIRVQNNKEYSDYDVHIVESRDSLFSISVQYYGNTDYVQEIMDSNEITNQRLVVGQKLIIPVIDKD